MQGLGLSIHLEESRLLRTVTLWRDHNMLHQLTISGSMLRSENHPPEWSGILAPALGLARDAEWPRMYVILDALPGSLSRKLLYKSSQVWYEREMILWNMWTSSVPTRLLFHEHYTNWMKLLAHTERKLHDLSWIEQETYLEESIEKEDD